MERVRVTLPKATSCLALSICLSVCSSLSLLTSVHVHACVRVYIRIYGHMNVNKPSTRCVCVQYTLFMVANVYVPTKLLFSLSLSLSLYSLRLLPLKGDTYPLLLKDHSLKRNWETRWFSYNMSKLDVDAKKFVYLNIFVSALSC